MSPQTSWFIRHTQAGDEPEIATLFQRCFGREISIAEYQWKVNGLYETLPKAWVVIADGKIVGHYGGLLMPVWYQKQVYPIATFIDGMVDPNYRRQGIGAGLAKTSRQTWVDSGVKYGLLLPNESWGSLNETLGWSYLFPLRWYIRPLHVEAMVARRFKTTRLKQWRVFSRVWGAYWQRKLPVEKGIWLERVDAGVDASLMVFDQLWHSISPDLTHSVVRNAAWVTWRYLTAPHKKYEVYLAWRGKEPIGYIVLDRQMLINGEVALVVDLFTHPQDTLGQQAIMALTIQQLIGEGVESLLGLAIPHTPAAALWKQAGGIINRGEFQVWFSQFDPQTPASQLANPQDWLMTGGAFDVI
jgi:GNAT superfamily N-acetyltransferase